MIRLIWLLLVASACRVAPPDSEPPSSCEAACAHQVEIGCKEGAGDCVPVCENLEADGIPVAECLASSEACGLC